MLLSSILFYSWGAPRFIFVILGTTALDFFLVGKMDKAKSIVGRKLMLLLSVSVNIGLLFYFKYYNFFIENLNSLLGAFGGSPIPWIEVILPIGISFYTFESITYAVDVYRKLHKPLDNFRDYMLYIILFPKLIAGPIIRYHEISDQITDREKNETYNQKLIGFVRFCIGLGKKVLIGNTMGAIADQAFAVPAESLNASVSWLGMITYTFQIYFDFSGYSDMAIGIGQMVGFKFPENFNNPYSSRSVTEFWRRWHMTLGNWMKNYLYIPLGGNKVKGVRLYFNLWFVFLASGIWHGAAWTFVVWGVYHGIFLVLERMFLAKVLDKSGRLFSTVFTFLVVAIGWVFFRAESIGYASDFIYSLFAFESFDLAIQLDVRFYFFLILAFIFSFFTFFELGEKIQYKVYFEVYSLRRRLVLSLASLFVFYLATGVIASSSFNPFIYFRF